MCVNVCSTWTAVVLLFLFHSSFFVHISANTICSSFICTFVWNIRCFNYCRTATILLYQVKRQKCYLFSVFTFFNVNKKNGHPLKDAYTDRKTIFLPPSTERRRMWKQEAAHSRGGENDESHSAVISFVWRSHLLNHVRFPCLSIAMEMTLV